MEEQNRMGAGSLWKMAERLDTSTREKGILKLLGRKMQPNPA